MVYILALKPKFKQMVVRVEILVLVEASFLRQKGLLTLTSNQNDLKGHQPKVTNPHWISIHVSASVIHRDNT